MADGISLRNVILNYRGLDIALFRFGLFFLLLSFLITDDKCVGDNSLLFDFCRSALISKWPIHRMLLDDFNECKLVFITSGCVDGCCAGRNTIL